MRVNIVLASAITTILLFEARAPATAATPTARFEVEPLRSPRARGFPILSGEHLFRQD